MSPVLKKPKIIAIVGPTASGKSELAVQLAKKVGGEILSVDSRQIYRGMDIGSGKVAGKFKQGVYCYEQIPHYGIDIASPKATYSAAKFQSYAENMIGDILKRGKVPILCGGTGHWIDSIIYSHRFPAVAPDAKLRKNLQKKSVAQLFARLKKLDPERAKNIDEKNPHRLIRALEIVIKTGKPILRLEQNSNYDVLWVGLLPEKTKLLQNIEKRLQQRLRQGMTAEANKLHSQGLTWKRLEGFGLEYKYCALFLQKKLSREQMETKLLSEIKKYAKRQLTWWKRNKDIHWINTARALALSKKFIKN